MSVKLKPAGKLFIIAAIVTAGILSVRWYQARPKQVGESIELGTVTLPDAPEASLSPYPAMQQNLQLRPMNLL